MAASVLRRAFLHPPFAEPLGEGRISTLRAVRLWAIASAIALDLAILFTLRDSEHVVAATVEWFAAINLPLLGVDFAISALWLRRPHAYYRVLHDLVIVIECVSILVWIQVTGSLSSYFLVLGFWLVGLYRFYGGYRMGLVAGVAMPALHLAMFALEELGVLQRAALFVADPGPVYASTAFRYIAMTSITWIYVFFFAAANLITLSLRSTRERLARVEKNLAKVAKGVIHGRLSGATLEDRYTLEDLLGRGGMGEVYRATRIEDGRKCAVKVLHPHLTDDREVVVRFEHEVQATSRLPGEYVAEILDVRLDSGECYIAMELLEGEDLAARLRRRGRLEPADLVTLMTSLARAVHAAHRAGVIHRDLKPHNVFLIRRQDGEREIRLLDFGISKLLEAETVMTLHNAVLGSPGFMSPEQARGAASDVGPQADVFALGAIAYQALSGERAFSVRNLQSALHELLHVDPPPLTSLVDVHPDVDVVIAIALAKDPAQRYATPIEFADDLARAMDGELSPEVRERVQVADDPVSTAETVVLDD